MLKLFLYIWSALKDCFLFNNSSHVNPNLKMISGKILKPYHFTHHNSYNMRLTGNKILFILPIPKQQITTRPFFKTANILERKQNKTRSLRRGRGKEKRRIQILIQNSPLSIANGDTSACFKVSFSLSLFPMSKGIWLRQEEPPALPAQNQSLPP